MELDQILLPTNASYEFQVKRVKMSPGTSARQSDEFDFCEDLAAMMREPEKAASPQQAAFRAALPVPMSTELKCFFEMNQAETHDDLKKMTSAWTPALNNYWEIEWIPAILSNSEPSHDTAGAESAQDESTNDSWIAAQDNAQPADQSLQSCDIKVGRDITAHLAVIFAQRRSYLFNPSLARRIHNVLLPPGWLLEEGVASAKRTRGFIIVPLVTFVTAKNVSRAQSPRSLRRTDNKAGRNRYRDVLTLTLVQIPVTATLVSSRTVEQPQPAQLRDLEHSEAATFCGTWDWSPARARRIKFETDGSPDALARSRTYSLYGDLKSYLGKLSVIGNPDSIDRPYTPRAWAQVLISALLQTVDSSFCASASIPERGVRPESTIPTQTTSNAQHKLYQEESGEKLHDHLVWALTGGKVSSIFIGPISLSSALKSNTGAWPDKHNQDEIAFEFANYLLEARSDLSQRSEVYERWRLDPSSISFGRDVSSYYVAPRSTLVHAYGTLHQTSHSDMPPAVAAANAWMKRLPLWMVGYICYYGIAISCARTLITSLNEDADQLGTNYRLLSHSSDRLLDAEEIFDFEFAVRSNRDFYHQLEQRDGVLSDFSLLGRKVDRVRADAILRREEMLSAAALWLSVAVFGSTGLTILIGSSTDHVRRLVGGSLLFLGLTVAAWIWRRTRRSP